MLEPAATLIRNLIDIAGKGGNDLLNVGPTGSWSSFKTVSPGKLKIAEAGPAVVTVKAIMKMPRGAVMNLRTIQLAKQGAIPQG